MYTALTLKDAQILSKLKELISDSLYYKIYNREATTSKRLGIDQELLLLACTLIKEKK